MGVKRTKIDCCKPCKPPKRHDGCHDTCKEYQKQKKEYEEYKNKINAAKNEDLEMQGYEHEKRILHQHRMHIKNINKM